MEKKKKKIQELTRLQEEKEVDLKKKDEEIDELRQDKDNVRSFFFECTNLILELVTKKKLNYLYKKKSFEFKLSFLFLFFHRDLK